jgi:hypothetical protein
MRLCEPEYLTGIWMSGFGVAADKPSNLFFATGNSNGLENENSRMTKLITFPIRS